MAAPRLVLGCPPALLQPLQSSATSLQATRIICECVLGSLLWLHTKASRAYGQHQLLVDGWRTEARPVRGAFTNSHALTKRAGLETCHHGRHRCACAEHHRVAVLQPHGLRANMRANCEGVDKRHNVRKHVCAGLSCPPSAQLSWQATIPCRRASFRENSKAPPM